MFLNAMQTFNRNMIDLYSQDKKYFTLHNQSRNYCIFYHAAWIYFLWNLLGFLAWWNYQSRSLDSQTHILHILPYAAWVHFLKNRSPMCILYLWSTICFLEYIPNSAPHSYPYPSNLSKGLMVGHFSWPLCKEGYVGHFHKSADWKLPLRAH